MSTRLNKPIGGKTYRLSKEDRIHLQLESLWLDNVWEVIEQEPEGKWAPVLNHIARNHSNSTVEHVCKAEMKWRSIVTKWRNDVEIHKSHIRSMESENKGDGDSEEGDDGESVSSSLSTAPDFPMIDLDSAKKELRNAFKIEKDDIEANLLSASIYYTEADCKLTYLLSKVGNAENASPIDQKVINRLVKGDGYYVKAKNKMPEKQTGGDGGAGAGTASPSDLLGARICRISVEALTMRCRIQCVLETNFRIFAPLSPSPSPSELENNLGETMEIGEEMFTVLLNSKTESVTSLDSRCSLLFLLTCLRSIVASKKKNNSKLILLWYRRLLAIPTLPLPPESRNSCFIAFALWLSLGIQHWSPIEAALLAALQSFYKEYGEWSKEMPLSELGHLSVSSTNEIFVPSSQDEEAILLLTVLQNILSSEDVSLLQSSPPSLPTREHIISTELSRLVSELLSEFPPIGDRISSLFRVGSALSMCFARRGTFSPIIEVCESLLCSSFSSPDCWMLLGLAQHMEKSTGCQYSIPVMRECMLQGSKTSLLPRLLLADIALKDGSIDLTQSALDELENALEKNIDQDQDQDQDEQKRRKHLSIRAKSAIGILRGALSDVVRMSSPSDRREMKDAAIATLRSVCEEKGVESSSPSFLFALAVELVGVRKYKEALGIVKKVLKLAPLNLRALTLWVVIDSARSPFVSSNALNLAVREDPDNIQFHLLKSRMNLENGAPRVALDNCREGFISWRRKQFYDPVDVGNVNMGVCDDDDVEDVGVEDDDENRTTPATSVRQSTTTAKSIATPSGKGGDTKSKRSGNELTFKKISPILQSVNSVTGGHNGPSQSKKEAKQRRDELIYLWVTVARCFLEMNELGEAASAAKEASDIDSNHIEVMCLYGEMAESRESPRIEEAIGFYTDALITHPLSPLALLGISRCCVALGKHSEAETHLRRLFGIPSAEDSIEGWTLLGEVLLAQGRSDEAAEAFRYALKIEADAPMVKYSDFYKRSLTI